MQPCPCGAKPCQSSCTGASDEASASKHVMLQQALLLKMKLPVQHELRCEMLHTSGSKAGAAHWEGVAMQGPFPSLAAKAWTSCATWWGPWRSASTTTTRQ